MLDLRSDTFTLPSQAMKEAMIEAPLGDDVWKVRASFDGLAVYTP
jgi:threonine aldolase